MPAERIQKLLAQANIASRRGAEALIEQKRVRVNGEIVDLGAKADPDVDVIEVDGERLKVDTQQKVYIALYKPRHVLTTSAPHRTDKRQTVYDLVGREDTHLFSIGRLDAESEGLIVLTNDGALAQKLSHPSFRHTKTYKVDVAGLPSPETLEKWRTGVFLEEGKTAPCSVSIVKGSPKLTTLRIVMTEGKKRQIRRVAASLGHPVKRLIRTHIGMLGLGNLRPGEYRDLSPQEVKALKTQAQGEPSARPHTSARPNTRSGAPRNTRSGAKPGSRSNERSSDRGGRSSTSSTPKGRSTRTQRRKDK